MLVAGYPRRSRWLHNEETLRLYWKHDPDLAVRVPAPTTLSALRMLCARTPTLKRAVPLLTSTETFIILCRSITFSPSSDPGSGRFSGSTLTGGALGTALASALGNAQIRKKLQKESKKD
jgi:hypothetical protein